MNRWEWRRPDGNLLLQILRDPTMSYSPTWWPFDASEGPVGPVEVFVDGVRVAYTPDGARGLVIDPAGRSVRWR